MSDSGAPVDPAVTVKWVEYALRGRLAAELLELHPSGDPRPGSALAEDDARYPREWVSSWCRGYLRAACDHMIVWANIVAPLRLFDGQIVENPIRPYFSLARGAIESAAQILWVLAPTDSVDRVERHLRLVQGDLLEEAKAFRRVGQIDAVSIADERVAAIATATGAPPSAAPGYVDMVRAAASFVSLDPDQVELTWRVASAAAHGKSWFVHETHRFTVGEEFADGYFRTFVMPDPERISEVFDLAGHLTLAAAQRYCDALGMNVQVAYDLAVERLRTMAPKVE